MPNIFHQSVEDILRAATPEQRLLWNYIFLRFGERIPISQFVSIGVMPAILSVYSANRLFVIYSFDFSGYGAMSPTYPSINTYNELNALNGVLSGASPMWDATAAATRYACVNGNFRNLYFSRIAASGIAYASIIGYQISI